MRRVYVGMTMWIHMWWETHTHHVGTGVILLLVLVVGLSATGGGGGGSAELLPERLQLLEFVD